MNIEEGKDFLRKVLYPLGSAKPEENLVEGLAIVTSDEAIAQYAAEVIWYFFWRRLQATPASEPEEASTCGGCRLR